MSEQLPDFFDARFRISEPSRPSHDDRLVHRFGDWWRVHRDDPLLRVALIVAVALAAGAFFYSAAASGTSGVGGSASSPGVPHPGGSGALDRGSTTTTLKVLLIHVAGAVVRPGVYELPVGARVADAVQLAGGAQADADLDRLNLAAKVADGQRVRVSLRGEPLGDAGAMASGEGAADGSDGGLVNLNTANLTQLETLPGVGPATAAKIVTYRQERGGFKSVRDLLNIRGIGEARFAELRDRVTV